MPDGNVQVNRYDAGGLRHEMEEKEEADRVVSVDVEEAGSRVLNYYEY